MSGKNCKLTAEELRHKLKAYSKREVIELLVESFEMSKDVQAYLLVKMHGDDALQKAIEEYKKINKEAQLTFEGMMYFVETAVAYIHQSGDISEGMGDYVCDVFETIVQLLNKEKGSERYVQYKDRLGKIINVDELIRGKYQTCGQKIVRMVEMEAIN